jgi:hypothetical protein
MRRIISTVVIAVFCISGSATYAQFGVVKDGAKKAGSVTKDVGKATAETTKDAAKATGKGTKKVATEANDVVQTTYACADGTTDKATVKERACREHGGVTTERTAKPKH